MSKPDYRCWDTRLSFALGAAEAGLRRCLKRAESETADELRILFPVVVALMALANRHREEFAAMLPEPEPDEQKEIT